MAATCASISRVTFVTSGNASFRDGCVSSSASKRSACSALSFRNRPAGSADSLKLPRDVFLGVVVSGGGSNRREVGFLKLGRFVEKKRRLASVRADLPAIVESEGAEKSSREKELINKLLYLVEGTDRGASLGKKEQDNVAEVVGQLEKYGIPEPLESPLLFGDWDVAYSSNPTSPGGIYRSWFGRLVFKTKAMIQTIASPDVVLNIVRFALFSFIHGQVLLKGKLKPVDKKLIKIEFEPPSIQLGPFKFKYGKVSNVKIAVIYLDETIRLGRGSRGTIFVFTKR